MAFQYTTIPAVLRRSDIDPIVSASNNDVEGIGFFATTGARDTLSNRLRQSNFLAIVGTDIYIYTGPTFVPSGVDDFIADGDWTDVANWETVSGSSTVTIADVTGLQTELTNLAAGVAANVLQTDFDGHSHVISDVTGLQTALDAKANTVHGHAMGDITDLNSTISGINSAIAGKADDDHTHALEEFYSGGDATTGEILQKQNDGTWQAINGVDQYGSKSAQDAASALATAAVSATATNATAISTNAGDIATNATGISTNSGGISTNTANISSIQASAAANASNISTNSIAISTNGGDISTNAGAISTNAAAIALKANSADLATVATTGSYNDLSDLPSGGGFSGDYNDLDNAPDLSIYATESDLSTAEGLIADNTTSLGTKANSADLATVATTGNYGDLSNKPAAFELDFTAGFSVTDTVGNITNGTSVSAGDSIEDYLVNMVTSYQNPSASLGAWGGYTSSTFTLTHGQTFSATGVPFSISQIGNVNMGDTGTLSLTDSHISNQTKTVSPASSGTINITNISTAAKVQNATTAGTGTARSRSNAFKITLSGFSNTNGQSISSVTKKATIYYRSRLCKSTTNYFSGITNNQAQTLFASTVATQTSSIPFSSYTATNGVGASDYLYIMVPESIHTYNGGTTTGVGTMEIGFQGAVTSTTVPVWCGTAVFAPVGSSNVKYHVLRVGSVGAYADNTKVKFA